MLKPLPKRQWTPVRAAHLLNRAGFGGSPSEIEALYDKGPESAVAALVDYAATPTNLPPPAFAADGPPPRPGRGDFAGLSEEERRRKVQETRRENRVQVNQLRVWWLEQMRTTPRPLEEKLTLFWHGHFATGFQKVRDAYAMYGQNQTLRAHAAGSWKDMLVAVSQDPAMLIYLDGARSSRRAPNENYARELMELFTLGEGQYGEEDIGEAARAFTGWSLDRKTRTFLNRTGLHDPGTKTFLGEKGKLDGTDVIDIILKHPASAPFICRKLWSFFAYADPDPDLVAALADTFRTSGYQFAPVLRRMFRSRKFYSREAGRTQIKSPVQWLVSTTKYLEAPLPPAGICLYMLNTLGQDLFDPPNVAGWEGGYAWITTAALLQRYNFASVLVEGGDRLRETLGTQVGQMAGRFMMAGAREDMADMDRAERRRFIMQRRRELAQPILVPDDVLPAIVRRDLDHAADHLVWRLFQSGLREQDQASFRERMERLGEPESWSDKHIRQVVHAMMSTPQFQLT